MTRNESGGLSERLGALSPEQQALLARRLAGRSALRGDADQDRITPRTIDGPVPLSHAQELIWVSEQKMPGTAAYNIPLARRIRGRLDSDALESALNAVVERHESLRTRFIERDGAPQQVVMPAAPLTIEWADLSGLPADTRAATAQRELRDAALRPIDLVAGTQPRVTVIRVSDDETLLLVVMHHIVFDGASTAVFFRELGAAYQAAIAGSALELQPLPIQFADVAAWERSPAATRRLEPALAFWRQELHDTPAAVHLPFDFPRPSGATGPGARHSGRLSPATREALGTLASAHDATLYMVLMAGVQALIHRYTGSSDVVVGTAISGRDRPETMGMVGYLMNALALRARFDGDPTFTELLTQVRHRAVGALEFQHVPFEEVLADVRAGMTTGEQSLFTVVLTLQDATPSVRSLGGLALEPMGLDAAQPKFDMFISAADVAGGVQLEIDYRSDLFRPETIARFTNHLEHLLKAAANHPGTSVSRLPLMSEEERTLVVTSWNATAAAYPSETRIHQLVSEQAARTPDALALIGGSVRMTYAQLEVRADGLAARLRQYGAGPGEKIGVLADRSAETVVAILAVLKAGAAYVPLDPTHPPERLAFIARDTNMRLLITRRPARSVLGDDAAVFVISPDESASIDREAAQVEAGADDIAYVIYTSGSTGAPKGVLVSHDNLMVSTWARVLRYDLPVSRYLLLSSMAFDMSVAGLFWTLIQGGALVIPGEGVHLDAVALCRMIRDERVSHLLAIPSFYQALLAAATPGDLASLRAAITGGDWCPPEMIERHFLLAPKAGFYTEYGPTETTVWCSVLGVEPGAPIPPVTIGNPMPNYRMYILDPRGEPMPIGVAGEIYIGGRGVSQGYLNRPELNQALFVPDPYTPESGGRMYRTGERGRWTPHGEIDFLGRLDFQVKVRGFRVELKEIEALLEKVPSVAEAAVILRSERGGEIVAYLVVKPGAVDLADPAAVSVHREDVRRGLARLLPDYMLPSAIVHLDAMPRSSTSGKIDRKALPAPEAQVQAEDPPQGPIEEVIAMVWRQALHVERIGRTTNFFELGGQSLLVTRVVAALAKLLRIHLPIRLMFDSPTIAGIATALVAREAAPGQAARVAQVVLSLQSPSTPAVAGHATNSEAGQHG